MSLLRNLKRFSWKVYNIIVKRKKIYWFAALEEFIQKLLDFEVIEKDEAVFYVEVSTEKAVVTWHKDGEEITGNDRMKVEVNGKIRRLVISSTNLLDEGEYTCVLGDLESTCELTVRELPAEIVKDMEDQTVNKAEKASFAVSLAKSVTFNFITSLNNIL